MKQFLQGFLIIVFSLALTFSTFAQQNRKPAAPPALTGIAKIVDLLNKSGYKYAKLQEGIWQIQFEGQNLKTFTVNISSIGESLFMFVDLASRQELSLSQELTTRLLELNDQMDTVKFALSDKSLYARIEAHDRLVDLPEFKYMIGQLSSAVDEAYPHIKPFLAEK
ncbi:MAG: hypothetical protein AB1757_01665 [Acidobacteriota bacterium]